ncbi:MAG TPA: tRNA (adenosine(37)-N6)-threonylcarbamoyltransferase complex ATPase subunit type 1 TsaE [Acidimicrobiales bacterium]|nr:tRNA (adenosine(37)-N6)-threonylcarbamoyltransferase complex ATPase subunit type 1 TsaE [Acidimicrobiales bacterium]
MTWQRFCATAEDTVAAGEAFASVLSSGDIVLLSGTLGAGKTTFVKGVAKGLGVRDRVTSPTFTMVREHQCFNDLGIETLHHADVYRVESLDEVLDLALGELVEDAGVALVEWGELAASIFGRDVVTIDFQVLGDDSRILTVEGELAGTRISQLERWAS